MQNNVSQYDVAETFSFKDTKNELTIGLQNASIAIPDELELIGKSVILRKSTKVSIEL